MSLISATIASTGAERAAWMFHVAIRIFCLVAPDIAVHGASGEYAIASERGAAGGASLGEVCSVRATNRTATMTQNRCHSLCFTPGVPPILRQNHAAPLFGFRDCVE